MGSGNEIVSFLANGYCPCVRKIIRQNQVRMEGKHGGQFVCAVGKKKIIFPEDSIVYCLFRVWFVALSDSSSSSDYFSEKKQMLRALREFLKFRRSRGVVLNFKTLDTGAERRLKLGKLRGLTANLWYFPQSFITMQLKI